jgi:hypothetical protein
MLTAVSGLITAVATLIGVMGWYGAGGRQGGEAAPAPDVTIAAGVQAQYRLILRGARSIADPGRNDLIEAVEALGEGGADPFLVLERTDIPQHYIQAYARDGGMFDLEFRDGRPDFHFACEAGALRIFDALWAYRQADPAFRDVCIWQQLDF